MSEVSPEGAEPVASPEGFMLEGRRHDWKMGRMPASDQDWVTEYRLLLKHADGLLNVYGRRSDEVESLTQQVSVLTDEAQQLRAAREQPAFHLGKRPETPEEIDAEVRLRETERRWAVELEDRKHRADLAFQQSGLVRRAEGVRGWALVAVVFSIIASPWVAMIAGIAAKDFSLYVTPVTGIAGAIIGYWFGQGQQNELRPPTIANSPTAPGN
ncbi:hypothetical protein [Streptomyces sp. B27]|uniref:hypothetical protein n=1 Tax=unclassified Streptomyces TaxID=2593676 RepID=UPI000FD964D4|nr:hypothetical protein [Streptomyces sp. B27]